MRNLSKPCSRYSWYCVSKVLRAIKSKNLNKAVGKIGNESYITTLPFFTRLNFICTTGSLNAWPDISQYSGCGGLKVACWPLVPKFTGSHPAKAVEFLGRKNPQHAFLPRGRKAVGPMS
jgi:hypothetical protein